MISSSGASPVLLALQTVTHHTVHALAARLGALDLTASEISTLGNLADRRPRSVRELSAATGIRATTLTGVLDRLERRGYLERAVDPADRRSFRLTLTASGRAAAATVHRAITDLERRALRAVSARQLAGFHTVITALREVS